MINLPFYEEENHDPCDVVFVEGMVTERILEKHAKKTVVVKDFTKLFITAPIYRKFCATGGSINVLSRSELIAICVNPVSPNGYTLDSKKVTQRLSDELGIRVYDIKDVEI